MFKFNKMIKAVILAVIFVSAYAEISKEERERIGATLTELVKDLSVKKIQKEEFLNADIDEIVKNTEKSGDCVNEAVQEWKSEGNKLIESAFNSPIMMLKNIADECLTLDEQRMEIVLIDVDSGNLQLELNNMQEHLEIEIQKTLESFKEAIENCQ